MRQVQPRLCWIVMTNPTEIDVVELAQELAEIARTTSDQDTGRRLMALVSRLLNAAGLPPDNADGGGEPPSSWTSEPVCSPA